MGNWNIDLNVLERLSFFLTFFMLYANKGMCSKEVHYGFIKRTRLGEPCMYCFFCGASLPEGAPFCLKCGTLAPKRNGESRPTQIVTPVSSSPGFSSPRPS